MLVRQLFGYGLAADGYTHKATSVRVILLHALLSRDYAVREICTCTRRQTACVPNSVHDGSRASQVFRRNGGYNLRVTIDGTSRKPLVWTFSSTSGVAMCTAKMQSGKIRLWACFRRRRQSQRIVRCAIVRRTYISAVHALMRARTDADTQGD